jgi:hypothetical protein
VRTAFHVLIVDGHQLRENGIAGAPGRSGFWRCKAQIVESAYDEMERRDKFLSECLGHLTHFERELVRAAFAVGRMSYAQDCDEERENMRELGLA